MSSPETSSPQSQRSDRSDQTDKRRLYGRAQGRPLSARQAGLVDNLLPRVAVPPAPKPPFANLGAFEQHWLEIGFGGAEHLIHQAHTYPDVGLIGVEPFLNGVAKALTGIDDHALTNINLHHGDARDIVDRLPDNCLDKVFVLFPDPWPKPRHFKRRILSEEFIAQIYRVLKPGGKFRYASDIISYVDWVIERIDKLQDKGAGFEWAPQNADDWREPYCDWPGTRYEAKAHREGRVCHYFEFTKPSRG